jgi:hypothetical protein
MVAARSALRLSHLERLTKAFLQAFHCSIRLRFMSDVRLLFSYGTLRQPEVQRALFGRALDSSKDVLPGFRVEQLSITQPDVIALSGSASHPVLRRGQRDEAVSGLALVVTADDLRKADQYEVKDYVRIGVTLASGRAAFAYVHRDDA